MPNEREFIVELILFIADAMYNQYNDNYAESRFGREKNKHKLLQKFLKYFGYISSNDRNDIIRKINKSDVIVSNTEYLYNLLSDYYSKEILIKLLAYRLLGYRKVKLPMNDGKYFQTIRSIERTLTDWKDYIDSGFLDWKLYLHDVGCFGFPCKLYYTPSGIFHKFVYRTYDYKPMDIKAEEGDHVIDAGACWGDTALYFSHMVGEKGRVYSFEFLPDNLKIFGKNISLNEKLSDRIELFEKPLWCSGNIDISCNNNGPGNRVLPENKTDSKLYKTVCIDDLARDKKIEKIDFIKMDIEGAELKALKGAEQSIIKWKPKLAISVYHKESDFKDIPEYLHSIEPGYKFYFDHFSIHHEESVLFARIESD